MDGVSELDVMNTLASGILFMSEGVWILVNEIVPTVSASIHGGLWGPAKLSVMRTLPALMDLIHKHLGVPVLRSVIVSDLLPGTTKMLERIGFQATGIIPGYGRIRGELVNARIYARYREV